MVSRQISHMRPARAGSVACVRFLILGLLEVRGENGAIALSGIKLRGLLAVLLLHANEAVSAERLALALWGQDAPGTAAKTVQVHVWRLRKALGDANLIETTPAGYCVRLRPDQLDVTQFERLVAEGRRALADGEPGQAATALREALGLWRGPALAELACEPFAPAEIARLEEQRLAALEARVEADLACGRHAELVGELRLLQAANPTRERFAAQLMLALYRCGRQTDALETYQDARRVLVAAVGVEPGTQLRELQQAILRHDVALEAGASAPDLQTEPDPATVVAVAGTAARSCGAATLALPRSLHTTATTPFVGRDTDFERLREYWTAIEGGEHSAVFIAGEAGIGKTRLATELARAVHREDALALYGHCDEGLAVPYQPFVEALRPYARVMGRDRLHTELGDLAPQLGLLLPELAGLGEPARGDPESERFALFEAVVALIEVMTRYQRTLLILDDLHWAARPTLLLLRHLIRCNRALRLLIVASYRETDLHAGHPLAQLLADLQRDISAERLSLSGLREPAIAALLEASLGHPLDQRSSELVQLLEDQTAGNPFFIHELLAHRAESGTISTAAERSSQGVTVAKLSVPEGLRHVITQRIARLSAPAQSMLRVAAVAGPTFSFLLLERVLGEQSRVFDALDETVAAGLLTEAAHGDYVFAHALVRQTIYQQLGAARRMRLHRQLGEALEASGNTDAHVEALAHHFAHAAADGQADKAIAYALAAGAGAIARLAYEDAAAHFQRGLAALTHTQEPRGRRHVDLLLELGNARWSTGESDKARDAFKQAANIADTIADAAAAAKAALGFSGPPLFEIGASSTRPSEDLLQRALAMLEEHDSTLRARLIARLAVARSHAEQHDSRALAHSALTMARRVKDKHALADVLAAYSFVTSGPDDLDHQLQIARELTRLAEDVGDLQLLGYGRGTVLCHLLAQGLIDDVRRELDELEQLAQKRNDRYSRWAVAATRAMLAYVQGQLESAESLAAEALRQWADGPQFTPAVQVFVAQMMLLRREQGRLDELVEVTATHAEQAPDFPAWRCALAQMHAHLEDRDGAARELQRLGDFSRLPRDGFWLQSVAWVGTVASFLDDHERSRQAYELLLPYANTCLVGMSLQCEGSTSRPLGMLATTLGHYDEAELHFEDALEMNAGIRSPLWTAHTQTEYARMLRLRGKPGDLDRARLLLATATATADELGLHALATRTSTEGHLIATSQDLPSAA
jgi:DNA-binding SARP family transcriptional activator